MAGARRTIEFVEALGARVRPTVFTPYETLSGSTTDLEMMAMNRQIFVPDTTDFDTHARHDAYSLIYGRDARSRSMAS